MPRERSDNTEAVNMKIPKAWIEAADKLAAASDPVKATRTAILRVALGQGLDAMAKDLERRRERKRNR
jgi:hypothetical protein